MWIIIITLIIVLLILLLVYRAIDYWKRYNEMIFEISYEPLKRGDIVYFINHTHSFINSFFTKQIFCHVGYVVGPDSIIETNYGDYGIVKRGIGIYPLNKRLKEFPGIVLVARLKEPLNEEQNKIIDEIINKEWEYPSLFELLKKTICPDKIFHCMGLVCYILDKLYGTDWCKKGTIGCISKICDQIPQYDKIKIISETLIFPPPNKI